MGGGNLPGFAYFYPPCFNDKVGDLIIVFVLLVFDYEFGGYLSVRVFWCFV